MRAETALPKTRDHRSPLSAVLVLGVLLALVLGSAALPAQANEDPAPPEPLVSLPKQVDLVDAYEGQVLCDPTPKEGAKQLAAALRRTYGNIWTNIPRDCNVSWDRGVSEHKDGRAVDWGVHVRKGSGKTGDAFAEWVTANDGEMARRMGIMYIIWDSAMWRLYDMDRGWAEYSNCQSVRTGSAHDTICHRDHMHISMTWHGAGAWSSWYDGSAVTQPACRAGNPVDVKPGTPGSPSLLFQPLEGQGVRSNSCYLGRSIQAIRLPVVENRQTVQRIRVDHVHTNAPSPVKIWTTGGTNLTLGHRRTATEHDLKLGTDGLVYIQQSVGQAGISIRGLGQRTLASAVSQRGTLRVPVVGGSTGVPGDAKAVSLNVTVTKPRADGFLTVYPCGTDRPGTSSVNYKAGQTVANAVVVGVGGDGRVCVYTSAEAHIVVDAAGFFPGGSPLTPMKPKRLTDTRSTPGKPTGSSVTKVRLPEGTRAGALNLTVTEASHAGWVSAYPCGTPWPGTSTVNYTAGQTIAGAVIVKAGQNRDVCVRTSAPTHIVVDLMATLVDGKGYAAHDPKRLLDSRTKQASVLERGKTVAVAADPSAPAVMVNLTATGGSAAGWVQAFPCGTTPKLTSNLNFHGGQTISNGAIVQTGGGKLCLRSNVTTDIVVDQSTAFWAGTFQAAAPRRLVDTRE